MLETSYFGLEFVALSIDNKLVEAMRYKLRCFGVRLDITASIFCDNKSVVTNASVPTLMFNHFHNAICYHGVRESQEECNIRVGWTPGERNPVDLLKNNNLDCNARHSIVGIIFHNNS